MRQQPFIVHAEQGLHQSHCVMQPATCPMKEKGVLKKWDLKL